MDLFRIICALVACLISSTALLAQLVTKNLNFGSRLDGFFLSSLPGLSMSACWKACKERTLCKSVNYQRKFHLCEFNSNNVDEALEITLTRTIGWVYYHNTSEEKCSNTVNPQADTCVKECGPHNVEHATVVGNILAIGSKVRVDCVEGFMTTSGPNISVISECLPDDTFTHTHCFPVTCMKIAQSPKIVTGAYKSYDTGSKNAVDIFCQYDKGNNFGYTFLSKTTLHRVTSLSNHFNLLDHVTIRHYGTNANEQYSSDLAVLSAYRSQYSNVSLFLNEYTDFNQPLDDSHKPYLHIGFVPKRFGNHQGTDQGYACNGIDYTFINSDGNPNNNFIFYQNLDASIPKGPCCQTAGIVVSWRTCGTVVDPSDNIPASFFYDTYEIHMGGGGGLARSNVAGAEGVIFGFLFSYV